MRVSTLVVIGALALTGVGVSEEMLTSAEQDSSDVPDEAFDRSYRHIEDLRKLGYFKKKYVLRPRWVKTWQKKKVYVPVWKYKWEPVEVNEWVPKQPLRWVKPNSVANFMKGPH